MRKIALVLLWAYVFTVPWDVVVLPGIGTITRFIGLLAIAAGLLVTLTGARFRNPNLIVWLAGAFAAFAALSLFWTLSYDLTIERVWSYAQLFASVWLLHEVARDSGQLRSLLIAWCAGGFVPMVSLLMSFAENRSLGAERYTSGGAVYLNANDMGLTLVLGFPVAWYLTRDRSHWVRVVSVIYLAVAPLAILLTASRGSFLAGLVALAIIPLTLRGFSFRVYATLAVVLVVGAVTAARFVPESTWSRLLTIQDEVSGSGSMSGRVDIWGAGLSVAFDNPVLGVGAGAYAPAVRPLLQQTRTSHNSFLSITVEQGIVGLLLFSAMLAACGLKISHLRGPERMLWAVLGSTWVVGVMSVGWETRKLTWLLLGLLAAQPVVRRVSRRVPEWTARRPEPAAPARSLSSVHARSSH